MKSNVSHDKTNGNVSVNLESKIKSEASLVDKLQKKLLEMEQHVERDRQALSQAVVAVLQIDVNRVITFYNKAAEKMFGYSPEEVVGHNIKIIFPITHIDLNEQDINHNEGTTNIDLCQNLEATRKNGTRFWINLSLSKSQVDNDVQYTVFIKDISDYKLLEYEQQNAMEQMKAQEEELRQNMEEMMATQEEMERKQLEMDAQMSAINSTSAYIQFSPEGQILATNDQFLTILKYSVKDIEGKHHRMFCDSAYTNSHDYTRFWNDLRDGKPQVGEFKRIAKDGSEVWMLAIYTPVFDKKGDVLKVITLATDITESKLQAADFKGQFEAIGKSQAVIEFNMDGTIIQANENFLKTVGYQLNEIKGNHHSMFIDAVYAKSAEYRDFWVKLNHGEYVSDEFKCIGKGGKEVWIQASYNPILDLNGKPFKVVKYATDVTKQKINNIDYEGQLDAIDRSNAVIEFNMDGTIITANDNFLKVTGYTLNDIIGKHHRIFVGSEYAKSAEYKRFWDSLNRGEFLVGTYTGLNKQGEEVYLQASYNPIANLDGRPMKVVKYALDMTEVIRVIKSMAVGDLSQRCDTEVDNSGLTSEVNKTLDNLNSVLSKISQGSNVVAKSSDLLQKKTDDMKRNTTEVATAISQIAKGAQDQASRTDESSRLINHVMTYSNDMEKKSNVINKAAEKGLERSTQGLKTVKVLVNNMHGIKDSAGQTSQSISVLTKRTEDIGRTLRVITDIASQTNLLALNAAIEAARAGDAGRGFAVVAEEIRKLAEDSRKSAVEIEKIIGDVQKDTQAAGKAIEAMEFSVKEGNKSSVEAEEIFQVIAKSSEETFTASKEIQSATITQKESISTVVKNIEQIVVVSEETAAGTQQVASSSQQMSSGMMEIAKAGDELSTVAAELQAGIQQFKLKK